MDRVRYLLGVITLALMVVAGWFLFGLLEQDDGESAFRIEVAFLDARGLKAGADVKYRGIQIGSVREVTVDEGGDRALVSLNVRAEQRALIRDNSEFWIVTPRFHGLSAGVTGLDTLVRDAYVACLTPQPFGEPRPSGSRFTGAEAPIQARKDVILPPLGHGDLLMQVMLPENHGIAVGAKVMFRGMPTGEVRGITLDGEGTHVVVDIRIASAHRATVTDASEFWVAQPRLDFRFSIQSPVEMNELGALVSPYLAYFTAAKDGAPLADGSRVAAKLSRPKIDIGEVPASALTKAPAGKPVAVEGPVVVVRVIYVAEDVDWLSPNDKIRREGTGILYVDSENRVLVLTPRSLCDASYFYTETFGESAEIKNERIRIQLAAGQALQATRSWVHEEGAKGADLTVLRVEGLPLKYPTSKPAAFSFAVPEALRTGKFAGGELHATVEGGALAAAQAMGAALDLENVRGAAVTAAGQVVGLVGQAGPRDTTPAVVTFEILPESLRPAR